jgi:membrane protein implicated in regulation of membrane protease activity
MHGTDPSHEEAAMSQWIGERGRVVEVAPDGRARALIGGRLILVSAYRKGPFTSGDAVRVVKEEASGLVVDVVGTRAEIVRP